MWPARRNRFDSIRSKKLWGPSWGHLYPGSKSSNCNNVEKLTSSIPARPPILFLRKQMASRARPSRRQARRRASPDCRPARGAARSAPVRRRRGCVRHRALRDRSIHPRGSACARGRRCGAARACRVPAPRPARPDNVDRRARRRLRETPSGPSSHRRRPRYSRAPRRRSDCPCCARNRRSAA